MARYRGPRFRLQRRLNVRLAGLTTKRKDKNLKTPGQHGQDPNRDFLNRPIDKDNNE